jgi:hypothetical protein
MWPNMGNDGQIVRNLNLLSRRCTDRPSAQTGKVKVSGRSSVLDRVRVWLKPLWDRKPLTMSLCILRDKRGKVTVLYCIVNPSRVCSRGPRIIEIYLRSILNADAHNLFSVLQTEKQLLYVQVP